MYNFTMILILFISYCFFTTDADSTKIVQLNVLFRHGDRMPETFPKRFPNDPNMKKSFYPMGSGGLTNSGKMRMYHLGKVLRNNYSEFLGLDYDQSRLFAVSSDTPRTKMSLQLVLAGLYPPSISTQTRWNPELDWQPIPTQYYELQRDHLFSRDKCEEFIEEENRYINTTEVQREIKKLEPYLEELRIASGKKSAFTLVDVLLLQNNLDIENRLNLTMEPWMKQVLADERLKEARMMFYKTNILGSSRLQRSLGGYFLRRINENMQNAANQTLGYENKIFLYSGHDKQILALLKSLQSQELNFPEFGCALIIELLSKNEKYFVKIGYYLGIPEETKYITIPGCATLCPLEHFLTLTKPAQTLDEEMTCNIKSTSYFQEE